MAACPEHADVLLDCLGLIEAQLRGDGEASTLLLDAGDNRDQASMLADILAHTLTACYSDPATLLGRIRPALLAAEGDSQ